MRAARIIIAGLLALCASAAAQPPQSLDLSGYHITFSDHFSSLSIKAQGPGARWTTHTPWHGDFGDAVFSNPNPTIFKATPEGLQIIATRGADGKWRSGLLSSAWADNNPKAGFTQKYGYFEMTAKLPSGMGTWPAFWLIGSDKRHASAEIDIIEYYGGFPDYFHSTAHVWINGQDKLALAIKQKIPDGQLSSGFNRFGVLITPKITSFYLNRREYWSIPTPPVYRQPMYMLVNLALGGGWPISSLKPPIIMYVKNITVWQRGKPWQ